MLHWSLLQSHIFQFTNPKPQTKKCKIIYNWTSVFSATLDPSFTCTPIRNGLDIIYAQSIWQNQNLNSELLTAPMSSSENHSGIRQLQTWSDAAYNEVGVEVCINFS